jgi:hypothetical protein
MLIFYLENNFNLKMTTSVHGLILHNACVGTFHADVYTIVKSNLEPNVPFNLSRSYDYISAFYACGLNVEDEIILSYLGREVTTIYCTLLDLTEMRVKLNFPEIPVCMGGWNITLKRGGESTVTLFYRAHLVTNAIRNALLVQPSLKVTRYIRVNTEFSYKVESKVFSTFLTNDLLTRILVVGKNVDNIKLCHDAMDVPLFDIVREYEDMYKNDVIMTDEYVSIKLDFSHILSMAKLTCTSDSYNIAVYAEEKGVFLITETLEEYNRFPLPSITNPELPVDRVSEPVESITPPVEQSIISSPQPTGFFAWFV